LADDTTLFLRNIDSLKHAFTTLDQFSKISGLLLNKNKILFYLGKVLDLLPDFNWVTSFKTLGVCFSFDKQKIEAHFSACLAKIKIQLNIWRQRDLSLKGKITVLKTLAVSKLIYIYLQCCTFPTGLSRLLTNCLPAFCGTVNHLK
jgi:hypothetical protein